MRRALLSLSANDSAAKGFVLSADEITHLREGRALKFPASQLHRLLQAAATERLFATSADPENKRMRELLTEYLDKAGAERGYSEDDFRFSSSRRLGVNLYWLARNRDYLDPFDAEEAP